MLRAAGLATLLRAGLFEDTCLLLHTPLGLPVSSSRPCPMCQQHLEFCSLLSSLMSCHSSSCCQAELCKAQQAGAGAHWNACRPHAGSGAHR